jgi:hypothetical protein
MHDRLHKEDQSMQARYTAEIDTLLVFVRGELY